MHGVRRCAFVSLASAIAATARPIAAIAVARTWLPCIWCVDRIRRCASHAADASHCRIGGLSAGHGAGCLLRVRRKCVCTAWHGAAILARTALARTIATSVAGIAVAARIAPITFAAFVPTLLGFGAVTRCLGRRTIGRRLR